MAASPPSLTNGAADPKAGPSTTAVPATPRPAKAADPGREQRLELLANTYLKTWRLDDKAMKVYAEWVARPNLEPELLAKLAAAFLARRDWRTLRAICGRMEKPGPLK